MTAVMRVVLLIGVLTARCTSRVVVSCVGDSITQRGNPPYPSILSDLLEEEYPQTPWSVKNFGRSGTTAQRDISDSFWDHSYYEDALESGADIFVSQFGTNDAKLENWNTEKYVADYEALLQTFANLENSPKIVVCAPVPYVEREGRWGDIETSPINTELEDLVRGIADRYGYVFANNFERFNELDPILPYYKDGIHPGDEGTPVLAENIFNTIKENEDILLPDIGEPSTTVQPTYAPTEKAVLPPPTYPPTLSPSLRPTRPPTDPSPTKFPTYSPTPRPTPRPTRRQTPKPTTSPTPRPIVRSTRSPTVSPTPRPAAPEPTREPTPRPTPSPLPGPTDRPTRRPTPQPTRRPTRRPTPQPTRDPAPQPSTSPTTSQPSRQPSPQPSTAPTSLSLSYSTMILSGADADLIDDAEKAAFERTVELMLAPEVVATATVTETRPYNGKFRRRRLAQQLDSPPAAAIDFSLLSSSPVDEISSSLEAIVSDGDEFTKELQKQADGTDLESATAVSVVVSSSFAPTLSPTLSPAISPQGGSPNKGGENDANLWIYICISVLVVVLLAGCLALTVKYKNVLAVSKAVRIEHENTRSSTGHTVNRLSEFYSPPQHSVESRLAPLTGHTQEVPSAQSVETSDGFLSAGEEENVPNAKPKHATVVLRSPRKNYSKSESRILKSCDFDSMEAAVPLQSAPSKGIPPHSVAQAQHVAKPTASSGERPDSVAARAHFHHGADAAAAHSHPRSNNGVRAQSHNATAVAAHNHPRPGATEKVDSNYAASSSAHSHHHARPDAAEKAHLHQHAGSAVRGHREGSGVAENAHSHNASAPLAHSHHHARPDAAERAHLHRHAGSAVHTHRERPGVAEDAQSAAPSAHSHHHARPDAAQGAHLHHHTGSAVHTHRERPGVAEDAQSAAPSAHSHHHARPDAAEGAHAGLAAQGRHERPAAPSGVADRAHSHHAAPSVAQAHRARPDGTERTHSHQLDNSTSLRHPGSATTAESLNTQRAASSTAHHHARPDAAERSHLYHLPNSHTGGHPGRSDVADRAHSRQTSTAATHVHHDRPDAAERINSHAADASEAAHHTRHDTAKRPHSAHSHETTDREHHVPADATLRTRTHRSPEPSSQRQPRDAARSDAHGPAATQGQHVRRDAAERARSHQSQETVSHAHRAQPDASVRAHSQHVADPALQGRPARDAAARTHSHRSPEPGTQGRHARADVRRKTGASRSPEPVSRVQRARSPAPARAHARRSPEPPSEGKGPQLDASAMRRSHRSTEPATRGKHVSSEVGARPSHRSPEPASRGPSGRPDPGARTSTHHSREPATRDEGILPSAPSQVKTQHASGRTNSVSAHSADSSARRRPTSGVRLQAPSSLEHGHARHHHDDADPAKRSTHHHTHTNDDSSRAHASARPVASTPAARQPNVARRHTHDAAAHESTLADSATPARAPQPTRPKTDGAAARAPPKRQRPHFGRQASSVLEF